MAASAVRSTTVHGLKGNPAWRCYQVLHRSFATEAMGYAHRTSLER
jgi:hypothetical protein